ncbi:hypothetical protein [Marixanthomonas spongiae]|uniref:PAP2 superfamily protein n=1 Tax=Marixanthomonas spongiae TaxID=2174845 RepID=A0A2U0HZN1_9FLAO|nr:hypothetical protein [Marixanthomonas spongiae]PVW14288.1 hypothetical protein DDV96_10820 [Marixanthomonas spongiae]
MDRFLRLGAYVLHPLWMPTLGTILYFVFTPRYVDLDLMRSKLFAVAIITLFVPIIVFFLLRNLGIINSMHLKTAKERKIPLMIQCILLLVIIKLVFDAYDSPELYYFFVGILFSTISALVMVMLKVKVSLHQIGIAGITTFVFLMSIHFKVNVLPWISAFFFFNGWVASSRLHTTSHNYAELIIGLFIGLIPQLIMVNFWL